MNSEIRLVGGLSIKRASKSASIKIRKKYSWAISSQHIQPTLCSAQLSS